jgi:hypothetical protein
MFRLTSLHKVAWHWVKVENRFRQTRFLIYSKKSRTTNVITSFHWQQTLPFLFASFGRLMPGGCKNIAIILQLQHGPSIKAGHCCSELMGVVNKVMSVVGQ